METTLGKVEAGSSFLFGGYEFIKRKTHLDDEFTECTIPNNLWLNLYITSATWVTTKN